VVKVLQVVEEDEIMLITQGGKIIRIPVNGVSIIGRSTQGVRLMGIPGDHRIVSIAKLGEKD